MKKNHKHLSTALVFSRKDVSWAGRSGDRCPVGVCQPPGSGIARRCWRGETSTGLSVAEPQPLRSHLCRCRVGPGLLRSPPPRAAAVSSHSSAGSPGTRAGCLLARCAAAGSLQPTAQIFPCW